MSATIDSQEKHGFLEKGFVIAAFLILSDAILPLLRHQWGGVVDSAKGDPLNLIMFSCIYGMALFLLFSFREPILETILNSKLLFGLIALAFLSASWSGVPLITVRRSFALLGTTIFGVYVGLRFNCEEQVKLLAFALGICAALSVAMALLVPSYGIEMAPYASGWRGVYEQKNHLGRVMALATIALALLRTHTPRGQLTKWAVLALCLLLVLLSRSVASLLTLSVLGVLLPSFMAFRWNHNLRNSFLALMLILTLGAIWWLSYNPGRFINLIERDFSASGRTDLWRAVFLAIRERPFGGYGYSAFWEGFGKKEALVLRVAGWLPGTAHSGLLDLVLELGVAGGVIFGVHYILVVRRASQRISSENTKAATWPLAYLAFMMLTNIAESPILRQNNLLWVLYVSTTVLLCFPRKRVSLAPPVDK